MNFFWKRADWVIIIVFALFIILFGYYIKLTVFDSGGIIVNSYNARMSRFDASIKRGNIYDKHGILLAASVKNENGGYDRKYEYPEALFHIIGNNSGSSGAFGIEAAYNYKLQKCQNEIIRRIEELATGKELIGCDINLTIDAKLSDYIYGMLKKYSGAVAAIEPATGKILAMVSSPAGGDSLLNRAANGLYEPASTFKIITAAAALEKGGEAAEFRYTCNGKTLADGTKLSCFNGKAHGEVGMKEAFAQSCNGYFASLALLYLESPERSLLYEYAEKFNYNRSLGFALDYRISDFEPLTSQESYISDLCQTAIGQGKTRTTALHQAMITASIANNGLMMKPYVLDSVQNGDKILEKYKPKALSQTISSESCAVLREYMLACVETGTGISAKTKNTVVAGKTGTGETGKTADNSWFVGFAPYDYPEIAISVILEEVPSGTATKLAGEILNYYFDK